MNASLSISTSTRCNSTKIYTNINRHLSSSPFTRRKIKGATVSISSISSSLSSSLSSSHYHPTSNDHHHALSPLSYNRAFSTASSSSSSSTTSTTTTATTTTTTTTTTRPPRPPSNTTLLPTLDVSPILDPTLYIKKSSKSNHTKCGSEASKRLLKAQHKIRKWIWDFDSYNDYLHDHGLDTADTDVIADVDADVDADVETDTVVDLEEEDNTQGDDMNMNMKANSNEKTNDNNFEKKIGRGAKSLSVGLVGHGVPFQLFQDHVDVAWKLLDQQQKKKEVHGLGSMDMDHDTSSSGGSGGNEVVECFFHNGKGESNMNWMKIRNREGHNYTIPYPLDDKNHIKYSSDTIDTIHHSMDLYLTVMNRLSRTFGTILQTSPSPSPSPLPSSVNHNDTNNNNITNKSYWKHDKSIPIKYWKTIIKRGFVYPPSATMFSTAFLLQDDYVHPSTAAATAVAGGSAGNSSNENGNSTTNAAGRVSTNSDESADDDVNASSNNSSTIENGSKQYRSCNKGGGRRSSYGEWTNPPIVELIPGCGEIMTSSSENGTSTTRGPSFVRVTIQGIPSSFWNDKDGSSSNGNNSNGSDDDSSRGENNSIDTGHQSNNGNCGSDRDDMVPVSLIFEACFQEGIN